MGQDPEWRADDATFVWCTCIWLAAFGERWTLDVCFDKHRNHNTLYMMCTHVWFTVCTMEALQYTMRCHPPWMKWFNGLQSTMMLTTWSSFRSVSMHGGRLFSWYATFAHESPQIADCEGDNCTQMTAEVLNKAGITMQVHNCEVLRNLSVASDIYYYACHQLSVPNDRILF